MKRLEKLTDKQLIDIANIFSEEKDWVVTSRENTSKFGEKEKIDVRGCATEFGYAKYIIIYYDNRTFSESFFVCDQINNLTFGRPTKKQLGNVFQYLSKEGFDFFKSIS